MKWSWRIGSLAGIGVYVHATFLILLAWVGAHYYLPHASWWDVARGQLFVVAIFSVVVLHELGHALAARRFGIRTRDITLLPIGGMARLERMPREPWKEITVALAGPCVNLVLAVVFYFVLRAASVDLNPEALVTIQGNVLVKVFWVNIAMIVFNMIPAFPMDGGRVLRGLLAMWMDYVRATRTAATIGQGMALVFGFAGLFGNPFLVFIALFVWMGAASEAGMARAQSALANAAVRDAMITEFHTLRPNDTLRQGTNAILAGFQHDFPVVDDGRVVGVLTRAGLMRHLAEGGPDILAADAMSREFAVADPHDLLELAATRLPSAPGATLMVVEDGRLCGMLTRENLGEYMMIRMAIRRARSHRPRS